MYIKKVYTVLSAGNRVLCFYKIILSILVFKDPVWGFFGGAWDLYSSFPARGRKELSSLQNSTPAFPLGLLDTVSALTS